MYRELRNSEKVLLQLKGAEAVKEILQIISNIKIGKKVEFKNIEISWRKNMKVGTSLTKRTGENEKTTITGNDSNVELQDQKHT